MDRAKHDCTPLGRSIEQYQLMPSTDEYKCDRMRDESRNDFVYRANRGRMVKVKWRGARDREEIVREGEKTRNETNNNMSFNSIYLFVVIDSQCQSMSTFSLSVDNIDYSNLPLRRGCKEVQQPANA